MFINYYKCTEDAFLFATPKLNIRLKTQLYKSTTINNSFAAIKFILFVYRLYYIGVGKGIFGGVGN